MSSAIVVDEILLPIAGEDRNRHPVFELLVPKCVTFLFKRQYIGEF